MQISVKVQGVDAVKAAISGRAKQVRFATAKALTDTAGAVKIAIPGELDRTLDRPTAFTKRGTFVRKADVKSALPTLEAAVGFLPIQSGYLVYQVEGGARSPKKKALRLPSNIPLDDAGNLPRGTIKALVRAAQSGKFGKVVQRRLGVAEGYVNRRKSASDGGLFYGKPRGLPSYPPGIYRRVIDPSGSGRGKLIPIIVFPEKKAQYRKKFDFYEFAARTVAREWPRKFDAALAYALATAR